MCFPFSNKGEFCSPSHRDQWEERKAFRVILVTGKQQCTELVLNKWYVTVHCLLSHHFLKIFIDLFIFRERGREGEREGEKHQCVVAFCMPPHHWGSGLKPWHVPWLGIKPVTLWFTGQHSIHWATPAGVLSHHYNIGNAEQEFTTRNR